jgi:hypothetical protein
MITACQTLAQAEVPFTYARSFVGAVIIRRVALNNECEGADGFSFSPFFEFDRQNQVDAVGGRYLLIRHGGTVRGNTRELAQDSHRA